MGEKSFEKLVTVYTDGGCDPNPGLGGYAAVLLYGEKRRELTGAYRLTTNNRMELMGVIAALEALRAPCRVVIHSDSKYVVNAMSQRWIDRWKAAGWRRQGEAIPNADLWQRLDELCRKHEVAFQWVRGHSGVPENERCDELATRARFGKEVAEDDGYLRMARGRAEAERGGGMGSLPAVPSADMPAEKPAAVAAPVADRPAAAQAAKPAPALAPGGTKKAVTAPSADRMAPAAASPDRPAPALAPGGTKKAVTEEGQACRKCGVPVVRREPSGKKKRKTGSRLFAYDWFLYCVGCKTIYMVNEAKVDAEELRKRELGRVLEGRERRGGGGGTGVDIFEVAGRAVDGKAKPKPQKVKTSSSVGAVVRRLYEAEIAPRGGPREFEAAARKLESEPGARVTARMSDGGTRHWQFEVAGEFVELHLHVKGGVTLVTRGKRSHAFLAGLATKLRSS